MTGFRFDSAKLKKRLKAFAASCEASEFRPEIEKFAAKALKTASDTTPVRSLSTIETNQRVQFKRRAQYLKGNPGAATRTVSEQQFIDGRAQARFLFRKTWKQVSDSVAIRINVSAAVAKSVTRRRPRMLPPRGYAQWRGGKAVFSLVVFNPFLKNTSSGGHAPLATARYKSFNPATILNAAIRKHRPAFLRSVQKHIKEAIGYAARGR